jgi:plastocyanin
MRFRPRLLKRAAGSRWQNRTLARLALATAIAPAPLTAVLPHSYALAANAHVLAYSSAQLCSQLNPGSGSQNCWYPANFHVNAGDQVSWASGGSGTHGLLPLNSGSPWPAGCHGDYPTCSFSQTGTYRFECRVHHASMSGSVTVDTGGPPAPQSRPTQPSGPQAGPQPPANPSPGSSAQALLPSGSPSASAGVSGSSNNNGNNSAGGGGSSSPAPLLIGVAALLVIAGGAAFYIRYR